jgi:hypothetical protein
MTNTAEPQLELRVLSQTAAALELGYTLTNPTGEELLVCNLLHRGQGPHGGFTVEPALAYVAFEPGPVPHLSQRIPEMGVEVDEETPVRPFATRLAAGASVEGRIVVAVPIEPFDAYLRYPPRDPAHAVPAERLVLTIGWLPAAEVAPLLVTEIDTTTGRLPYVKVAAGAQRLARAELALSVLVLPPALGLSSLPRSCTSCGATNLGDQAACLRCGGPLSAEPPTPPPPPPAAPVPTPPPPAPAAPAPATPAPATPAPATPAPATPAPATPAPRRAGSRTGSTAACAGSGTGSTAACAGSGTGSTAACARRAGGGGAVAGHPPDPRRWPPRLSERRLDQRRADRPRGACAGDRALRRVGAHHGLERVDRLGRRPPPRPHRLTNPSITAARCVAVISAETGSGRSGAG